MPVTEENTPAAAVPKPTELAKGVTFDIVCREWRCKWDSGSEKLSLKRAQAVLDKYSCSLAGIDGMRFVQRIVCGGCLDFKVIVAVTLPKWGDFEKANFLIEDKFLTDLKEIEGISKVETQTYTWKMMYNYETPQASVCQMSEYADGSAQNCWVGGTHTSLWLDDIGKIEKTGEAKQDNSKFSVVVEDCEVEEPVPPIWQTKKRAMIPMKKVIFSINHPMTDNEYIKYIYARDQDDALCLCVCLKPTNGKAECEAIIEPDAFETLTPFACSTTKGLMKGDTVPC
jgi:desulfoferrodoxin (superoxide reductase-like protein)